MRGQFGRQISFCRPKSLRSHKSRTSGRERIPDWCKSRHAKSTFTGWLVRLNNPTAREPSANGFTRISAGTPGIVTRCAGLPSGSWSTASTSGLVRIAVVHSSLSGRFMPSISGDEASAQSDIRVNCSSRVKRVQRSGRTSQLRWQIWPKGIMSPSGQWPGPVYSLHRANKSKLWLSERQLSQKSGEMRQRLANRATCAPWLTGVAPGRKAQDDGTARILQRG